MTEQPHQRRVRSFVMRAGRITKKQQQALDHLWPHYGIDLNGNGKTILQSFIQTQPTIVEIGFGMGASLVEMARDNPKQNYIGIEVYPPGIGSLLSLIEENALNNVRVIQGDAVEALADLVDDATLAGVQIFFPDPWHKKKHHKRRLINPHFINQLLPKIQVGGFIHAATDWQDYAEQILDVFRTCQQINNPYDGYAPRPETRPLTKFEKRGQQRNHPVWDVVVYKK